MYNQVNSYSNIDNSLLRITFRQSDYERIHISSKEVMSFIDKDVFSYVSIISELGGIMFLLSMIGCFLATPLAEFSFKLDAINQIKKQGQRKEKEDSKTNVTQESFSDSKPLRRKTDWPSLSSTCNQI